MEISEKVAYLKGLAEGLALDTESKEGKLIAAIIDVLDDMSEKFEDLEDELCDVEDGLDAVSDDLCEVEEALYELEDDDDEYDEDEDDDEEYFETTCPVCEEEIVFDEDTLESGEIRCPNCGEKLEFDLSDLADAEDEDEEYDDFEEPVRQNAFEDRKLKVEDRRNKVVNIHATTQLKVVLVKPERFENASEIADHLREKRTVVLNLEGTNKDVARRLVDFLSGVAYAGDGKIKKVSTNTYIITPYSVDLMGDLIDELENNGLYL